MGNSIAALPGPIGRVFTPDFPAGPSLSPGENLVDTPSTSGWDSLIQSVSGAASSIITSLRIPSGQIGPVEQQVIAARAPQQPLLTASPTTTKVVGIALLVLGGFIALKVLHVHL